MANTWFRVHSKLLHNAKVQALRGEDFKILVNLWCLACESGGNIPGTSEIAFQLRISQKQAERAVEALSSFFEPIDNGMFRAHDWNEHQFISDGSTERVRAFRERTRNVTETLPKRRETVSVTAPDTDTEQIQNRVEKASPKSGSATAHGSRFTLHALPEGWAEYCRNNLLWDQSRIDSVFEDFRLFWVAKAGRDGRKADWLATWQGWCRRESNRPRSPTLFPRKPDFVESVTEVMRERIGRGEAPL
jgi:hypothetical protein